uniref:Uncharacterized protein n=1 Tax=Steinernema glaseri TaxID=37863 RepID=A0A1I7Z2Y3_9BILA
MDPAFGEPKKNLNSRAILTHFSRISASVLCGTPHSCNARFAPPLLYPIRLVLCYLSESQVLVLRRAAIEDMNLLDRDARHNPRNTVKIIEKQSYRNVRMYEVSKRFEICEEFEN